jgi:hypothetical protein
MSTIVYSDPKAPAPTLGSLGSADEEHQARVRQAACVPLIIAIGANLIFFVQYWLPETNRFPTRDWWLTQLAPLVSKALTSSNQSQVEAQDGPWGLTALMLLAASFAVFGVCRSSRLWLGPWLLAVPMAVGLVAAIFIVIALILSRGLTSSLVSVMLLIVWLVAAGFATVGKIFDAPPPVQRKTWRNGLPLLAAYAVVGPVPTAVGRWLFAPELRAVADKLQDNDVALRLAALWTPVTGLFYLCGVVVGIALWMAYQWWPPRERVAVLSLGLVGLLVLIGVLGWPTSTVALERVRILEYSSPQDRVHFPCGSWLLQQPDGAGNPRPVETLAISGFSCKTVTTYQGYHQVASQNVPATLSPVRAETPEGAEISGKFVAAQYDDVIVVAGSDRLSSEADQVFGLGFRDGSPRWHFQCGSPRPHTLTIRFARVPAGDDPARGHLTLAESKPQVIVGCDERTVVINPITGAQR